MPNQKKPPIDIKSGTKKEPHGGTGKIPDWIAKLRGKKITPAGLDKYIGEIKAASAPELLPLLIASWKTGLNNNDETTMKMVASFFTPVKPVTQPSPVTIFNKNMATASSEAKAAAASMPTEIAARPARFDDIVRRIQQQQEQKELLPASHPVTIDVMP